MNTYVALLRGINVGGRKVGMSELKALFEKQGFTSVVTLLQSGNVIFQAKVPAGKARATLEDTVGKEFGYEATIFVYPASTIAKLVNDYPFDTSKTDYQHYIIFLDGIKPGELTKLPNDKAIEKLAADDGVVYWQVKKGHSITSAFSKQLTKTKFKNHNTVRNINTLQKIIAKTP